MFDSSQVYMWLETNLFDLIHGLPWFKSNRQKKILLFCNMFDSSQELMWFESDSISKSMASLHTLIRIMSFCDLNHSCRIMSSNLTWFKPFSNKLPFDYKHIARTIIKQFDSCVRKKQTKNLTLRCAIKQRDSIMTKSN